MESFFSSLETKRAGRKNQTPCEGARADVFDYTERFYNPKCRVSTAGFIGGVGTAGAISLSGCHPNRVQASAPFPIYGKPRVVGAEGMRVRSIG
jgi:hypothetical protein